MRTAAIPCLLAALVVPLPAVGAAPDLTKEDFRAVADKVAGALVTVKHVLKVGGGGADMNDEDESEVTAVMIDPGGLVVCSNSVLLGQYGLMARFNPEAALTVTPTEIKVLIGDDSEGVPAKVLSRDTELDLAWLQIENPGDAPYQYVDLAQSAEAVTGEQVITVGRLGKFFDRSLTLREGRIAGKTSKPRDLIIADGISTQPGSPDNSAGMPVFTAAGRVLGIAVLQLPGPEEMEGGGGMDELRGFDRMILPAAEVLKATQHAREVAGHGENEAPEGGGAAGSPR